MNRHALRKFANIAALALVALASACAHAPEPEVRTVTVKVPVPVTCKAEVDVHDAYADAAAVAGDIYEQAIALLTGRAERDADIARLKGAVIGCGGVVK